MKIRVIGDNAMVLGFSLLGVREGVLTTAEKAEEELRKALEAEDIGMVILLDDFAASFSHKMKRRIESTTKPVVVIIPGKAGSGKQGATNLAAMIKKAIGVELKAN
ncbi:MAG: V-type ATP synthase subunit F [Candidatus Micrarchaeia archaeon]|jgi:vacuolar-type H+-ATPase subunit F/Vma7